MIIDSNLVSLDSVAVTSSAVTGNPIALTSFLNPGRMEPIPVCAKVVAEDFAGGTSITFKLIQSDTKTGSYTDVPGSSITKTLAELTMGKGVGWRYLPRGASKPWLNVVATPTGTFTAGKVFAAIVREDDLPMETGMYFTKGKNVG